MYNYLSSADGSQTLASLIASAPYDSGQTAVGTVGGMFATALDKITGAANKAAAAETATPAATGTPAGSPGSNKTTPVSTPAADKDATSTPPVAANTPAATTGPAGTNKPYYGYAPPGMRKTADGRLELDI